MNYNPTTILDKTGREIVLRSAQPEDAGDLITYLKVTAAETPYLVREPEEITLTLEQEQAFITNLLESERELMLIATADGRHVGNCSLMSAGSQLRYRHRCSVAIALYKEFWGRGIGRAMLETVLRTARETGYEQAELEVAAGNKSALALYESLGFVKYGVLPDNMKYKDGSYSDTYWMMKKL